MNAYGAEGEDYNPFRRMFGKKSTHNPFRYSGEYFDSETGFIYLRNRMYDPSIGRFTTEDPAKDGLNWYAYCMGNPVNRWDPWGLNNKRYVITESSALNMRKDIGTDSEIICELERGTEVEYTGEKTSTKVDGHYWAKVTLQEGKVWKTGWVAAEYLGTADPSGKVERSVPVAERAPISDKVHELNMFTPIADLIITYFLGAGSDVSDPMPTYLPQDAGFGYEYREEDQNYHSMAEAAAASSPSLNNIYLKNMYGNGDKK